MRKAILIIATLALSAIPLRVFATDLLSDQTKQDLTAEQISIAFPDSFKAWPEPEKPAPTSPSGPVTLTYTTEIWGTVTADFNDFRAKVAATLNDPRGWTRAGVVFKEVDSGGHFVIALSGPAHLDAINGCSGELSCTTWSNQVIINDLRWLYGTDASNAAGVSQRDYQHMVVNHEVGHWLGHYSHIESCPAGGPAPIMLQQSTGLRGCDSFNSWPLDFELWTNWT